MDNRAFGSFFSPRMFEVDWNSEDGWGKPYIKDYQPFQLDPWCGAVNHGLQCFEGLKAYHSSAGVRLFRPENNIKRLATSFARLQFPSFDHDEFLNCLKELVRLDRAFVPTQERHAFYIRPAAIATSPSLSPAAPTGVKLFIITSPVGPYYRSGFKPVKLLAEPYHRRAWPGGHGNLKVGPNYAGTVRQQLIRGNEGYTQILWLGPDNVVDEVGAMNFLMLWTNPKGETELITAPLDGTILPGVTRDSILELTREWGEFAVTEKRFKMEDVVLGFKEGRVKEMFGCGTAATVSQIESLSWEGVEYKLPVSNTDTCLSHRILKELTDIQTKGGPNGNHRWSIVIEGTKPE